MNIKSYIILGLAAFCALSSIYFFYAQHEIKTLSSKIATYELTIEQQNAIITRLNTDMTKIKVINDSLVKIERNANTELLNQIDTMKKLKNTTEHKKTIVQKLINNGSKERIRCFELATGAPSEINEKNSLCTYMLEQKE